MNLSRRPRSIALVGLGVCFLLGSSACDRGIRESPVRPGPAGNPELREALFDSILAMTARRSAFSLPKQEALGFDPLEEMETLREKFIGADSEDALFDALHRLSNARRDRHLSVSLVEGGIRPTFTPGLPAEYDPQPPDPREAPVRFLPDYGSDAGGFFISDVASSDAGEDLSLGGLDSGDQLVEVNGVPVRELVATLSPYVRHSSIPGLRWKIAEALSRETAILPESFRGESLNLTVEKADGTQAEQSVSYYEPESLQWAGRADPTYSGFEMEWSTPTYDLYLPVAGQRAIVLQWHRFESSSLMEDIDRLVTFGEDQGLLDHAIVFDATRSGGGSLGAYAIQRIQPKPFKTTFGTLRLSDVTEPFVQVKREEFAAKALYDSGGPETVDDGTWLMDWLENDLLEALARGDSVTAPVPFKLAHAPKDSDGILQPTPVHFRGPLVVLSGP
ncbi:MAG: hypothetical protein KJN92_06535, partial [Gemmatimonadetes bacterium]|nr:hypothetical protein [Gemmatimonadota bacterium]